MRIVVGVIAMGLLLVESDGITKSVSQSMTAPSINEPTTAVIIAALA